MKITSRFAAFGFLAALLVSPLIGATPARAEFVYCPTADTFCQTMAIGEDGTVDQELYEACMMENCYDENTPASPETPEMSDILAGAFIIVSAASLYFIRKRRLTSAA